MTKRLLPIPETEEEFIARLDIFEDRYSKERRVKTEFLKHTFEGYENSRELFFERVSKLYFFAVIGKEKSIELFGEDFVTRCFANYDASFRKDWYLYTLKKLVQYLRKIAECDYFLGLYDESIRICEIVFEIVDKFRIVHTFKKLAMSIMARVFLEKKEYSKACEYIYKGLDIDPSSETLKCCKDYLGEIVKYFCNKNSEEDTISKLEYTAPRQDRTTYYTEQGTPLFFLPTGTEAVGTDVLDVQATVDFLSRKGLWTNEDLPSETFTEDWPDYKKRFFTHVVSKRCEDYERNELIPIHIPFPSESRFGSVYDDLQEERIMFLMDEEVIREVGSGFFIQLMWKKQEETKILWKSLF